MNASTFYHQAVLLHEAVNGLAIKPNGVYVDATFGGGGHSREILAQLGENGKLIAFDQDEDAWSNLPDDNRLQPVHENFRYLKKFLRMHGHSQVDGVLADLGVSSFQFDTADRGFSIRFEGPLDMRMDKRMNHRAADLLFEMSAQQLQDMFSRNAELRNAKQLAQHLVAHRGKHVLSSTEALKALIAPVVKGPAQKYYAQVFQALRIEVNEELQVLHDLLVQAQEVVRPGGRLSIITFHSLEDRVVKQFLKAGTIKEDVMKGDVMIKNWKLITPKPIIASAEEQKQNSRSRSAKLRIAEKL